MDVALFSPASLFYGDGDGDGEDNDAASGKGKESTSTEQKQELHVERTHTFPGMDLIVREFSFHQLNANLLWPGTFIFSTWLVQNQSILQGARILEMGSGTGALAIFLRKSFGVDITTSDFDDEEIEENISYNCKANQLDILPHVRHSWGDIFPTTKPDWDLIIASDILLYVKQYPNLIKTLCFLLNEYKPRNTTVSGSSQDRKFLTTSGIEVRLEWPAFIMSWRRRIGKEEEALFLCGCEDAGLSVQHVGSRVYCIRPTKVSASS